MQLTVWHSSVDGSIRTVPRSDSLCHVWGKLGAPVSWCCLKNDWAALASLSLASGLMGGRLLLMRNSSRQLTPRPREMSSTQPPTTLPRFSDWLLPPSTKRERIRERKIEREFSLTLNLEKQEELRERVAVGRSQEENHQEVEAI